MGDNRANSGLYSLSRKRIKELLVQGILIRFATPSHVVRSHVVRSHGHGSFMYLPISTHGLKSTLSAENCTASYSLLTVRFVFQSHHSFAAFPDSVFFVFFSPQESKYHLYIQKIGTKTKHYFDARNPS